LDEINVSIGLRPEVSLQKTTSSFQLTLEKGMQTRNHGVKD